MSIDTRVNQDSANTITEERTAPPAQITISQIVEDLENGRDRQTIKAKYGLTADEVKMIFEHPKLKGMRVKKARTVRFTLVDDMQETVTQINLEETAEMLYGVDNTNVEGTFNQRTRVEDALEEGSTAHDQQTRIEEGLDHKGEESGSDFDIDTIKAFVDKDYDTFTNQTEIQD